MEPKYWFRARIESCLLPRKGKYGRSTSPQLYTDTERGSFQHQRKRLCSLHQKHTNLKDNSLLPFHNPHTHHPKKEELSTIVGDHRLLQGPLTTHHFSQVTPENNNLFHSQIIIKGLEKFLPSKGLFL